MQPTTIRKAATFGVTLGVVLQGQHDEILVDPERLLVITRETETVAIATAASARRPYLGMSLCFAPERVARALLALGCARASEVATNVGFESAAHFAREFKRRFGVPPTHYLRSRSLDSSHLERLPKLRRAYCAHARR